jgi:hypothetical protein
MIHAATAGAFGLKDNHPFSQHTIMIRNTINTLLFMATALGVLCAGTGCTSGNNQPISGTLQETVVQDTVSAWPYPQKIAGEYQIAPASLKELQLQDAVSSKTTFNLQADSTFKLSYFPLYDVSEDNLSRYNLSNGSGTWRIEKSDEGPHWYIEMTFDTIIHAATGKLKQTNLTTDIFRIQDTVPPHAIFMVVNSMAAKKTGVLLLKK